jgi:predicted dehydrogenase
MNALQSLNRRDFILGSGRAAAALAAGTLAAPSILRGATPESEPVRVGHIGIGTRGGDILRAAASNPGCRVVAVCDVYQQHLRKGAEMSNNPDVRSHTDYHALLDDPQVEAVVIGTPDHWHEQMLLDAVAAGKDVYCEKGWTTSVAAAKRMRDAVRKAGAVMQLGHQGRQLAAADVARRMILDGAIGEVTLVNVGRFFNGTPERPPWRWYGGYGNFVRPDPEQVLRELDWERWLGSAPKIDFNERHFWHWRCYHAYGTGQAGDLLSHEMDFVQSVLRYGIPDTCATHAHNTFWHDDREAPDTWLSSFVFEKQNCCVTFEGSMNSRRQQTPEFIGRNGRMIFSEIGQNASLFETYGDEPAYRPARRPQAEPDFFFTPGAEHRKPDHITDFLRCVRTREKPQCNEDEAFIEAVTLLMSFESHRQKRLVRWDPRREEIV